MAIRLVDQYPGKTAGVQPGYPHGKARNVSAPNDGTGTPLEAALVNDDQGFKQALLAAAGIAPNGSPDSTESSQYLQALMRLFVHTAGLVFETSANQVNFSIPVGERLFTVKAGVYNVTSNPGEVEVSIAFDRSFATKCQTAVLTRFQAGFGPSGDGGVNLCSTPTVSGFKASLQIFNTATDAGLRGFHWIAVGY